MVSGRALNFSLGLEFVLHYNGSLLKFCFLPVSICVIRGNCYGLICPPRVYTLELTPKVAVLRGHRTFKQRSSSERLLRASPWERIKVVLLGPG